MSIHCNYCDAELSGPYEYGPIKIYNHPSCEYRNDNYGIVYGTETHESTVCGAEPEDLPLGETDAT